ncbi:uncharacterized transporter slc-17.2-like [Octopus sinensis]|uniref:Uncharacterized transporter slc-17.2-like n=1 Tax=Octopus sinensis TaxID=2607531 RepID=A0A7E6FMR8_9MOLL|nr:uncharacterized transporter slc-17.2-like [Octopus sinensis]
MSRFTNRIQRCYSCRWRLCYICAIASLVVQTLRVDISMAFVCMLKTPNRTSEEVNVTTDNQHCSGFDNRSMIEKYEGEFEWSDTLQSNILAGYFYGYIATNYLGGLLADKYGAKRVVGGSILSASILTILHPSLSRISGYLTLVLRILTGMASGPIYPAFQSLYGRWAPPQEIGSLVGLTFAGLYLGNIVGLSISGYLCLYGFDNGWGSIFYIFGGLSGGVLVNNNDIAPSYAGIIFGIANTIAATSGSISPLSAKALTPNGTQEEWQIVFALNATVCVVCTILYAILATGEIQDWAISEDSGSPVHLDDMNTNKSA